MNRLLVIDDEKIVRNYLKRILEENEYLVDTAEDIDTSLNLIQSNSYECVILDIVLPGQNGLILIEKMREMGYQQPVILITGKPDIDSAKQAVKFKAYDYLTKPINNAELFAVVKNAIKQNQIQIREEELKIQQRNYRKKLEHQVNERLKELNESEIKYKNLIEQSLVGVYVIQQRTFQYVNKRFLQLIKYPQEEVINKIGPPDLATDEFKAYVKEKLNNLEKGANVFSNYSFTLNNKDQQAIDVEVWEGKIIYEGESAIQGIILDVSERRKFYEREKDFELKLMHEHKLGAIGQLATGIAHNLNTPISVILGNAELLQLKYNDSPEVEKIVRQAEKMSAIIQSLLTKSSREQMKQPQLFDLNLMINSELDIFEANLDFKHNVEKKLDLQDNIPEFFAVYSDFSQSIMNLMQNAIDAMYGCEKKELGLSTSYDGNTVIVKITDNGCGIDEKDMSKLFDPFYTTKPPPDQRVKDEPTGTGLGLSSVHTLLSEYGVEIDFDSAKDRGTKVTLKIPYASVSPP